MTNRRLQMKLSTKLRLLYLFHYQDVLKMELFCCEHNWEEQQIRDELEDVTFQIKRMEIEV